MTNSRSFTLAWVLALLAAVGLWIHGIYVGHMLLLEPRSETCPDAQIAAPYDGQSFVPLSNICHYVDGSSVELVPGYVNPLFFAALAAVVLCFALAVRARRIRRASARSEGIGADLHEHA